MIFTVYFVPREGVHPHASLADYGRLWPIMHRSVKKLGHRLMHITDMATPSWGDDTFRVDVDPATTVYSRDVAWAKFVASIPDDEQACMIEPDTVMLREFPPIVEGRDLVLLRRPSDCIPGWFKLATNQATPFFEQVVDEYKHVPLHERCFHGDMKALLRAYSGEEKPLTRWPGSAQGCEIEWRDWKQYGHRGTIGAYFHQYKGNSKHEMLRLA